MEIAILNPGDVIDMYHMHLPKELAPSKPQPDFCQVDIQAEVKIPMTPTLSLIIT